MPSFSIYKLPIVEGSMPKRVERNRRATNDPRKVMVTIRMTQQQAYEHGLLICTCGHPVNNHFDWGDRSCANCDCKKYVEKARTGTLVKS